MRLLFLILFVVALIAWNLQRKLEESKDWTEKQDAAAGKRDTFIQMMGRALTNSVNVKSIVFLVAVYLTWNIVAGTMGQFMPYMYAAAGNLDDTTISLLQAVMWILTAVGSLAIFSKFGDKIPHRILFAATAVMALAAWVVMVFFGMQLEAGTADSWGWLLWVFVALWGISAGFSAQCFYALRCPPSCSRRCTAAACRASCSSWCAAFWASGRSWPWRASAWKPPRAS